jgi:hypothetical protein
MHPTYWNFGREERHQLSFIVMFMQPDWLRGLPVGSLHHGDSTSTEGLGSYHQ